MGLAAVPIFAGRADATSRSVRNTRYSRAYLWHCILEHQLKVADDVSDPCPLPKICDSAMNVATTVESLKIRILRYKDSTKLMGFDKMFDIGG